MRFATVLFGWLALIGAGACGSTTHDSVSPGGSSGGSSEGSSAGAGTGGTGAGGDGARGGAVALEPPCFDPAVVTKNCAELSNGTPLSGVAILRASDLAGDARFRKLGGSAVLIEIGPQATPRIAVVNQPEPGKPVVDILDIDASGGRLEIVSVAGEALLLGSKVLRVFALNCPATGCQIFGVGLQETTLQRLPDVDLPANARVNALAIGTSRLCAYGAGLWCLESGQWLNVLSADITGDLASVALGAPGVAITMDGKLFTEHDGQWQQTPTNLDPPVTLQTGSGVVSAVDADGSWYVTVSPASVQCQQSPKALFAMPGSSDSGRPWLVALDNGVVYEQRSSLFEWCEISTAPEPATWISTGAYECHDATNLLALSETTLYSLLGPIACYVR